MSGMNLPKINLKELKKQKPRETGFSGQVCGMADKDK